MKKKLCRVFFFFSERVIACVSFSLGHLLVKAFGRGLPKAFYLSLQAMSCFTFYYATVALIRDLNRMEVKCCLASTRIPRRFRFKTISALIV